MRDDFDPVVADRFKVLDRVAVPDVWSRVQRFGQAGPAPEPNKEVLTMIDLETPLPNEPRQRRGVLVAAVLAAAAVVAIAFVATRDGGDGDLEPSDQPSATVTVALPTVPPARALFGAPGDFEPGTYFVDEVEGTPTPRIFVALGEGWSTSGVLDGWGIRQEGIGFITFSRADRVLLDACHPGEGYHPGPLTTADGLVTALREQAGWTEVGAPAGLSIDGYTGTALQRTAPTDMSECTRDPVPPEAGPNSNYPLFPSFELTNDDGSLGWSYYEPGETETLWVLDVDGTIVILNTRLLAKQPTAAHAEFAAVLDSVRITPP